MTCPTIVNSHKTRRLSQTSSSAVKGIILSIYGIGTDRDLCSMTSNASHSYTSRANRRLILLTM